VPSLGHMNLKSLALVGWIMVFTSICDTGNAALPSYSFTDFEADSGWSIGPFPSDNHSFRLLQGSASIVGLVEQDSRQALQLGPSNPYPVLFVDASAASKSVISYCELLARPFALDESTNQEFLNFGGAVIGFFREGNYGEVQALFANSPTDSVWISTGRRFDLDGSGLAAQWLRITIKLDRSTGRWDLRINGVKVLSGLEAVPEESAGLALWLDGDVSHPYYFDDILLSVEDPDRLQRMAALENERAFRARLLAAGHPAGKFVVQNKRNEDLRQLQPAVVSISRKLMAPVLRDWSAVFRNGSTVLKTGHPVRIEGRDATPIFYSPQYDANGRPLPANLTMIADAELKPGTDLSKLRWIVAEMVKWPDQLGEVVASGDFSTGLVQEVTIPPNWVLKATLAYVWVDGSPGDIRNLYKFTKGMSPKAPTPQGEPSPAR